MKTLLFLINILSIAIASPIQRSEIPLRRGYEGNINAIYAGKGDLKNSSANENRNQESGNDDPQEGEMFLNLNKGYVTDDELLPVNALNLQETYHRETGNLPLHSGAGLMEDKGSSQHSTQENMGTYAPFPVGKAVLGYHTDLIPKSGNGEQNTIEHLRDKNAVHAPESAAEGSVAQEKDIFSDKQHIGGFQATNGFMVKQNVDVLYSEHYLSLGNYHFSDEGMQGDDPGYADDFDSTQQGEDQSNSSQQQGELDSPSSSNEGSKHSNTAKDSGSLNDSSSSTDVNSPTDSKNSRDSSASKDPSDFSSSSDSNDSSSSSDLNISSSSDSSASKDSSDSSSSSDSNDSSSSSDLNDTSSSSDSRSFNDSNDPSDSNKSDSSSLSDSSDSSDSSESRSSSDSGDSDSLNDSSTPSTSTANSNATDW